MVKFGFVIPVFNVKKEYLKQCIESIQNQNCDSYCIVLVDDGASQELADFCDQFARENGCIKTVHHEKNLGLPAARNTGIEHCDAEWIAFIDSDDWIEPDMCQKLSEEIESFPADIYIYSGFHDYSNNTERCTYTYPHHTVFETAEEINSLQERYLVDRTEDYIPHSFALQSACIRLVSHKLFDKGLRFVNVRFAEDALFHLYSCEMAERIVYLQYNFYHYRNTEGSMVNSFHANVEQEQLAFLNELFSFARENHKDEEFMRKMNSIVFLSMQLCVWQKYYNKKYNCGFVARRIECRKLFARSPFCSALKTIKGERLGRNQLLKLILFKFRAYALANTMRNIGMLLEKRRTQ